MELRRLRYFCAVADAAHLTRAAEGLGIRATSLSQQIQALERELGVDLFVRTSSGMRLTAAGAALLPQARTVLAAAERVREVVRDTTAQQITFHIGVTPGSPSWVAGRLWTAIRDRGVAAVRILAWSLPFLAIAQIYIFAFTAIKAAKRAGLLWITADVAGVVFAIAWPGETQLAGAAWSIVLANALRAGLFAALGRSVFRA